MGMSQENEKQCRVDMLNDYMDLSGLIVHAQKVEKSHLWKSNREDKWAKSLESGSSKSGLDMKDKPMFNKRFSNQVSSSFSKNHNDRGTSPKPQDGRNVDPPQERPACGKCCKKNRGE